MKMEMIQDVSGAVSSKRVVGISSIALAALMSVVLFIICIIKKEVMVNHFIAIDMIKMLLFTGTGLLGVGVLENFTPNKSTDTAG